MKEKKGKKAGRKKSKTNERKKDSQYPFISVHETQC